MGAPKLQELFFGICKNMIILLMQIKLCRICNEADDENNELQLLIILWNQRDSMDFRHTNLSVTEEYFERSTNKKVQ